MAPPNRGAPPPPPKEEIGYFGVFVNISIPQLRIQLREPITPQISTSGTAGGQDAGMQLWPELHMEVSHPSSHAILVGASTRVSQGQDGTYQMDFSQKFRMEPTMEALHELLNRPMTFELFDAPTSTLVATAQLDLLPFALGEHAITLAELPMDIDAAAAEAAEAAAIAAAARPASQSKRGGSGRGPRNPGAPMLPRLATPPVLSGLSLTLTHREAPAGSSPEALLAAAAASSSLTSSAEGPISARPGGGAPKPGKAGLKGSVEQQQEPVIDEKMLPPLEPFRYLPEGVTDPAELNVLEVTMQGPLDNLPPGLLAAHEAAGGRLSFMAGLTLPPPCPPLVIQSGVVSKEGADQERPACIAWPNEGRLRQVLKPDAVHAILGHLDGQGAICVEVARYVEPDKSLIGDSEAAWNAYHGRAVLPDMDVLLEGGTKQIGENGMIVAGLVSWEEGASEENPLPSTLPAYTTPPGKFKPIEDVNPGTPATPGQERRSTKQDRLFSADGKAGARAINPLTPPASFSAWEAHGTKVTVGLKFARALLPEWAPPAAPTKKLQDFIPQRDMNPPPPPVTCDDDFRAQVTSILTQLAAAYLETNSKPDSKKLIDPGASPLEANKKLVKSLNKTGRYMAMRDGLKTVIVRTVQERFRQSGNMSPNEMSETYGPLYSHLLGLAQSMINKAADDSPAPLPVPEPAPPAAELAALTARALEAEAVGDTRRSAALMRRCLLDMNNAQVHVEAAALAARSGQHAYALSLLRFAIEIDPGHQQALAAASLLYLDAAVAAATAATSANRAEDKDAAPIVQVEEEDAGDAYTHWNAALACADALLSVTEGSSKSWVVLALVHQHSSVVGPTDSLEGSSACAANLVDTYAGLGGAGGYGRCITELKRRMRGALKAQQQQQQQQRQCSAHMPPPHTGGSAGAPAGAGGRVLEGTEEGEAGEELAEQGAGQAREGGAAGNRGRAQEGQAGMQSVAEELGGRWGSGSPAAAKAHVAAGAARSTRAEGIKGMEKGCPPAASTGVMEVWHLLLELGLRGLADQACVLATTVFLRSTSTEPQALALALGRTHMLPPQPHFQQLARCSQPQLQLAGEGAERTLGLRQDGIVTDSRCGGGDTGAALVGPTVQGASALPHHPSTQAPPPQQGFCSPRQTQSTEPTNGSITENAGGPGGKQVGAGGDREGQAGMEAAAGDGLLADAGATGSSLVAVSGAAGLSEADFTAAMSALRKASRIAEAAAAQHSWQDENGEGGPEAAEQGTQRQGGCLDVLPLLLMGDLLWMAAGEQSPQGSAPGPGGADQSRYRELRRQSRMAYQTVFELVGAAAEKNMAYSPEGRQPVVGTLEGQGAGEGAGPGLGLGVGPWRLVRAHLRLGRSFLEDEGLAQCAMDVCAAAAALWPTCTAAWKGAAMAAQALGDASIARAAWAEANIQDTEDGQAWAALAAIDLREGRKQEAVAAIDKALALTAAVSAAPLTATSCPASDAGGLLVEAAAAASKVGNLLEATMWLHRALDIGHHTSKVYQHLASVEAGRQDMLSARAHAQRACELACTAAELETSNALQQSLSLESNMQKYALGIAT